MKYNFRRKNGVVNYSILKRLVILIAVTGTFIGICIPVSANTEQIKETSISKKLSELEATFGGRIGIFSTNIANNQHIQYRASERFPIQSTFKAMAVSALLKQSMADNHLLQQKVAYTKKDL